MKKQAKIFVAGLVLSVMALTGCNGNSDNNDVPNVSMPTSTATATVAPTATSLEDLDKNFPTTTEDAKKAGEAYMADIPKAHGINLDVSMEKYLEPDVVANFPNHDVKEGVKQGLSVALPLHSNQNMKEARKDGDLADSKLLFGLEDKIDGRYMPTLVEQMDNQAPFPTAGKDGRLMTIDDITYSANGVWKTTYNNPGINYVASEKYGSAVRVLGMRSDLIGTTAGVILDCDFEYSVVVIPGAGTDWLVTGMGFTPKGCEVVNASK